MNDLLDLLEAEGAVATTTTDTVAWAAAAPSRLRGVRLMSVEVYNWGTFDRRIWRLDLMGGNGLLTGQNGSGKSTLVDAITTLLVPAHRISYNKAGQAERDERDLRSYVLGTYKSERASTGSGAKPVSLRSPQSTYSVILGRFHNADLDETTTLAQVFWFKEQVGPPARFFVVAEQPLSIEASFTGFGRDINALRKRLRAMPAVDVHDNYPSYGAAFRRRLGIPGEQAIDLFLQTVSMKTVGDLTGFVRRHMLEPFPVEARIDQMIRHFDDLTRAHGEVVKARQQIEMLTPIVADCDRHAEVALDLSRLTAAREALKAYMATLLIGLIDERRKTVDGEIERMAQRIAGLRLKEAENEQTRLAIERDINANGGTRLGQIELELRQKAGLRDDRQRRSSAYAELTRALGLDAPRTPEAFADRLTELKGQLTALADEESTLQNKRSDLDYDLRTKREGHQALTAEIESLKRRRSNLPAPVIALREQLSAATGIGADAMPFAGELIEVRPEAAEWEGAAERLLHNFALTLLVPARHYEAVSAWADGYIGARLVYYRVPEDVTPQRQRRNTQALSEKLRLKADTPLYSWLQREVDRRFDHICCASLEQFRRETKAVTRNGQIKGGGDRHEKDDRHRIDDRTRYVLGWSNAAKIAALEVQARASEKAIQKVAQSLAGIISQAGALSQRRGRLAQLSAFQSFADIDFASVVSEISTLEEERRSLTEGSDVLRALRIRQQEAETAKRELRTKLDDANANEAKLHERRDELDRKREAAEAEIAAVSEDRRVLAAPSLDALRAEVMGEQRLTIEGCSARESEIRKVLQDRIDSRQDRLRTLGARIAAVITGYRNRYPEETREIDNSVEAADDLRKMLAQLREEGLPRFEARFKSLLNENAIREVAGFQSKLREEERTIRERIERINESLRDIDYHDGTYIAVEPTATMDGDVRDFQQDLRKCTEGALTGSEDNAYAETKFLEVKRVIERFRGRDGQVEIDLRWTRKVTDVRNWFEFSASERWRADDTEREHYSDSGGKSGGQKEKLAYTILAASLAYQFGLEKGADRSRAFHFVMIDEAFGRGSDEAAEFGLTLFKKMGLQLLIATPLQKIHVIEPHVSAVGFVHNEDGKRSLLRNLTIEEYRVERERRAGLRPAATV
ncbi:MAG: ATP-binding protein [Hyphomicrobiaceae bacterium]